MTTGTGTTSIAYDWESRITSMTGPGVNSTFAYNGLDTRVTKNAQSFLRDGAYVTDPVLRDGQATFTPGISERRGSTTTFQHSGLKNADAQSSIAQTLTATKQYDAFGNLASSTGTWQGPFGYAGGFGYQTEFDSGLMLLGHRYLDPSTGRFLTRDPAKDGRNWYGYCENNPVGYVDEDGLLRIAVRTALQWLKNLVKPRTGPKLTPPKKGPTPSKPPAAKQPLPVPRTLKDPDSLKGASQQEVEALIPKGWIKSPSNTGGGTKWADPDHLGDQVRVMPGSPKSPELIKQGPYALISKFGKKYRIPLAGNPTLK